MQALLATTMSFKRDVINKHNTITMGRQTETDNRDVFYQLFVTDIFQKTDILVKQTNMNLRSSQSHTIFRVVSFLPCLNNL